MDIAIVCLTCMSASSKCVVSFSYVKAELDDFVWLLQCLLLKIDIIVLNNVSFFIGSTLLHSVLWKK